MRNPFIGRYNKRQYIQAEDFISEGSFSSVSTVDFVFTSGMLSKYRELKLLLTRFIGSGGDLVFLRMSQNFGSSFDSGANYRYVAQFYDNTIEPYSHGFGTPDAAAVAIEVAIIDTSASILEIRVINPNPAFPTTIAIEELGAFNFIFGGGDYRQNAQVSAIRLLAFSGTMSANYIWTGVN